MQSRRTVAVVLVVCALPLAMRSLCAASSDPGETLVQRRAFGQPYNDKDAPIKDAKSSNHVETIRTDHDTNHFCRSSDEPSFDFGMSENRSIFPWPPKCQKSFAPQWRASRRSGRRPVTTTLYSVHLNEGLPVLNNQTPPDEALDELFRCRGFGERRRLDARLVKTVIETASHFVSPRIEVISGYRSPKLNDSLAKKGRHVASESKHTQGLALDFRVMTAPATAVAEWLSRSFEGGIGVYPEDNFVHIDMGPKRRWRGR